MLRNTLIPCILLISLDQNVSIRFMNKYGKHEVVGSNPTRAKFLYRIEKP